MTTNLPALLIVALVTNQVEHWPMRWVPDGRMAAWNTPGARWVQHGDVISPETGIETPNLDADSMSVETTVTRQRLLSFEFEQRKFSEVLTNEPAMHYSVEMQRVRTNAWKEAETKDIGDYRYYEVLPQAEAVRLGSDIHRRFWPEFLVPTNYFVPVKTNELPLVPERAVYTVNHFTNWQIRSPEDLRITNYIFKDLTNLGIATNDDKLTITIKPNSTNTLE